MWDPRLSYILELTCTDKLIRNNKLTLLLFHLIKGRNRLIHGESFIDLFWIALKSLLPERGFTLNAGKGVFSVKFEVHESSPQLLSGRL